MDIRKLQRLIVDALEDVKAQDIVVFNTEDLSPMFERVIIASATSNRQTKALAISVREAVRKAGEPVPRSEGEENAEWIIVDCGAVVVHVMQTTIRSYYHLEEIWGEKPVRVKLLGNTKPQLAKGADISATPKKTVAKRAVVKKVVSKTASSTGAATRKTAAKKIASASKPKAAVKTTRTKIVSP